MSPIPIRHLGLVAEAFVTLTFVRVGLRLFPQRMFRNVFATPQNARETDVATLANVFATVSRKHPLASNCLHRSLALQRMLRRRGAKASLRIGIGRRPNFLPGHAWIEVDGRIINDYPEVVARYEPLLITESALSISYAR